jgi:peptide/nickel transport system permease protein
VFSAVLSITIGVAVGVIAGFRRGVLEEMLMGTTDVFLLIPGLPLMIILAAYLSPSQWNIVLVIGLLWWCPTARVVHARTLQLREAQFMDSTKMLGYSDLYIVRKHVIPNTFDLISARFGMAVATGLLSEASLSFLGLGDPFHVSWGGMIDQAFSRGGFVNDMWWWYLTPGFMIIVTIVGFILLGSSKQTADREVESL